MGFSEKIKAHFKEKGLNNRQISEAMDNYSESLISRYMNSDTVSISFLNRLVKYFPDIDINYMIKDDDVVNQVAEDPATYQTKNALLIEEIQQKLNELKRNLSQD